MENILSIFINKGRSFVTFMEKNENDFTMKFLDSAENSFFDENLFDISQIENKELTDIIGKFQEEITGINVIYSSDFFLISRIPYSKELKPEVISQMIKLETDRTFPKYEPDDFIYDFHLLSENKLLSFISPKIISEQIENYLVKFGKPVYHHFNEHHCSLNSLVHNYPEIVGKNFGIVSIQKNRLYFSLIGKSALFSFSDLYFANPENIPEILEKEIKKFYEEKSIQINGGLFFYGSELTKSLLSNVQTKLINYEIECERLNPYKNLISNLNERAEQYASRAMQNFSSCIGSVLPDIIEPKEQEN